MQIETLFFEPHRPGSPLQALVDALVARGEGTAEGAAWLLPRIEQALPLRQALARRASGGRFSRAPLIISADRLSNQTGGPVWTDLVLQVAQQLRTAPTLALQARSGSQLWALATEYAELALACVARDSGASAVRSYLEQVPFAGAEASLVLSLADIYRDTFLTLLPGAPDDPQWVSTDTIVWLDDGEPLPAQWLAQHAGCRRVLRVPLLLDEGQVFAEPPASTLQLLEAPDVDALAQATAGQIARWLRQSPDQPIGVAVVDRLHARRVRSVLEASGIKVDDRTGWRVSTTRVAGWLHALLGAWFRADWHALTAALSPRWLPLASCFDDARFVQAWVARVDRMEPTVESSAWAEMGLALCRELDVRREADGLPPLTPDFTQLIEAFSALGRQARSLSDWARDTLAWLQRTHATGVLQQDEAGLAVLAWLRRLSRAALVTVCEARDFLLVVDSALESSRFRAEDIASPVRFMPLQSFRLQRFGRVVVLGCAARHFVPSPPGLLPPAVATELGLSDGWQTRRQSLSALHELVACGAHVVFAHAQTAGGQGEPLLGWLHALLLSTRKQAQPPMPTPGADLAGSTDLAGVPAYRLPLQTCEHEMDRRPLEPLVCASPPPQPTLVVEAVTDLASCPLKFALRRSLKLRDRHPGLKPDRLNAQRGEWVHDVFQQLHRSLRGHPAPVGVRDWLVALRRAFDLSWERLSLSSRDALFQEKLEFQRKLPALAEVLHERAIQGWQTADMERELQRSLSYAPDQPAVQIEGRLDSLQVQAEDPQRRAIVDIKTTAAKTLTDRSRQWSDYPQLPMYAWLLKDACEQLAYLAVRGDKLGLVALPHDGAAGVSATAMAQSTAERLAQALTHVWVAPAQAHPLPGEACQWCDYKPVCRQAWWAPQADEAGA